MFDPTHVPKAAAKQGAGRVFDHTWVGSREALGAADHRATPVGRSPDPRFQTPPEHRPVDLGKILPAAGLVRFRAGGRSARAASHSRRIRRPRRSRPLPEDTIAPDHARPSESLFNSDGPGTPAAPPEHPGPANQSATQLDVADPFALSGYRPGTRGARRLRQ